MSASLPRGLPPALNHRLEGGGDSLVPCLKKEGVVGFNTFLKAVGEDGPWRTSHLQESGEVFVHALEYLRDGSVDREKRLQLIHTLAESAALFQPDRNEKGFSPIFIEAQSEIGQKIIEGKTVPRPRQHPAQVEKMLYNGLSNFDLQVRPETPLEDLVELLRYTKEDKAHYVIYPLVEEELLKRITIENAYALHRIGQAYHLVELQFKTGEHIRENLKEESLQALIVQAQAVGLEEIPLLVSAGMNYALDQLPKKFEILGEWPLTKPPSQLTPDQQMAYGFIQEFGKLAPYLKEVDSDALHQLPESARQWVLEQLPANLTRINISHLPWKDLSRLKKFLELKRINATECVELSQITDIKNFKNLEEVILHGCPKISNIMSLRNMSHLCRLYVHKCLKIKEIQSVLEGHPNLKKMTVVCDERFRQELLRLSVTLGTNQVSWSPPNEEKILHFQFYT